MMNGTQEVKPSQEETGTKSAQRIRNRSIRRDEADGD